MPYWFPLSPFNWCSSSEPTHLICLVNYPLGYTLLERVHSFNPGSWDPDSIEELFRTAGKLCLTSSDYLW